MTTTTKKTDYVAISKTALPTSLTAINALVAKATKQGNQAQHNFQIAACAIIQHLGINKDIRVVRNFIADMPEGLRADSMAKFFDLYAAVSFDDDGVMHYDADKPTKLGNALEKPWWKAKAPSVYTPFSFVDELEKLYNRATKKLERVDVTKGDDLTAEDINKLRSLIQDAKKSDMRLVA